MIKAPMRILLVSYVFPPFGGAGVQRISKLAEFLVSRGHQVSVITHESGALIDNELVGNRLINIDVLRISFFLHGHFDGKDLPQYLNNFITKINPDIIFSSSPVAEAHSIAEKIKYSCKKPWIADFRDLNSEYVSRYNVFSLRKTKKIERHILRRSDAVTVISDYHKSHLQKLYAADCKEIEVVMNGYDSTDFLQSKQRHSQCVSNRPPYTVAHVGTFYGKRTPLFLIINAIIAKFRLGIPLNIVLVGNMGRVAKLITKTLSRFISIETIEYVPHSKAIEIMCAADMLVLVPGSFGVGVITGKVFEYVASGRAVINLYSYKGPLNKILANIDGVYNVHEFDYVGFTKALSLVFTERNLTDYDRSAFTEYERSNQYAKLEDLMSRI